MCGGRGTRLGGEREKPLVAVAGTPMIDRVCDALAGSRVDGVYAAVSPHAPATRAHLRDAAPAVNVVGTPGDGYVADLTAALDRVGRPALTVAADLPLLAPEPVDRVLAAADGDASLVVAVPVSLKRRLGVSDDATVADGDRPLAPTGLNVVAGTDDDIYVSDDPRLAVNVNRPTDLWVAEALS
ncbi:cobalamin biosynthesis protein CobY [Haloplanus rubicundus]|uniref:Cobalamin biosynthesis protein CobY n=1 Tax=Haloplanus rubicundus TaxID=1547898 RepID=A0A345E783_9EURY|nr:cobalamin biosynthesis protein CobY [Haloplanus rubicundus]